MTTYRTLLAWVTLAGRVLQVTDDRIRFENEDGRIEWFRRDKCLDGDVIDVDDTDLVVRTSHLDRLGWLD